MNVTHRFAGGVNIVVAVDAQFGGLAVIECRGQPCAGVMALIALQGCRDMQRRFGSGVSAVVAAGAYFGGLRVIE